MLSVFHFLNLASPQFRLQWSPWIGSPLGLVGARFHRSNQTFPGLPPINPRTIPEPNWTNRFLFVLEKVFRQRHLHHQNRRGGWMMTVGNFEKQSGGCCCHEKLVQRANTAPPLTSKTETVTEPPSRKISSALNASVSSIACGDRVGGGPFRKLAKHKSKNR